MQMPTFDIPVKFPLRVEVLQSLQHLPEYDADVGLLEDSWLHQVVGRPAAEVFHDDPQFGTLFVIMLNLRTGRHTDDDQQHTTSPRWKRSVFVRIKRMSEYEK